MSPKDRVVIDLLLKRNVVGVCPKDKAGVCRLVRTLFKVLGLVWKECRLLDDEVRFITEDEIGQEYYNKKVNKRGE